MPSRTVAAVACAAFVPCSGFVRPGQLISRAPSTARVESLHACIRPGLRPNASLLRLRSHGVVPRPELYDSGLGQRAARRGGCAARRRLRRFHLAATGGGEGGCEMEGEVGEGGASSADSAPIARAEAHGEGLEGDADGLHAPQLGSDDAPAAVARDHRGGEAAASGGASSAAQATAAATPATPATSAAGAAAGMGASGLGGTKLTVDGGAGVGASLAPQNSRREVPLPEREGFAVVEKVLPSDTNELEMDLERLRGIRSQANKLKRNMRQAVAVEDYKKAGDIKREVAALRAKDPLCVISDMLGDAVSREKFKRAAKLRDAKDWILQESRGSVFDVDRLVCLGNKASNVITTDPEGSDVHRFLENHEVREIAKSGQIQLPVWSPDGRMVAFSVLKAGKSGTPIESARILVYRESGGLTLDVSVPRPPFLLMWSPNSQSLTYLSNTDSPEGPTIRLSEILVAAAKSPYKTKARGLAQGNPLFYAFTKKSTRNADMVVHTGSRVYFLDMTTGKEVDISSSAAPLFMAPSTHCVGGEDATILVEGDTEDGQHLISARVDGSAKKKLCPTRGFSTFGVSPDGRRVCLMQQDLTTGFYTISVLEGGEGALDPLSTATMEQVEIPLDRVVMAFFFSPDSKKLLCLATKMSKNELAVARSSMRLGFQLKFQWMVYDCESRNVQLMDEFSPRQFFLKMYLPYFDMFAQGFTPWAPDAKAFAYVADKAAYVQEVPDEGLAPTPRELGVNMEFVSWSFC